MCTVSIIPFEASGASGGFRVVCNRDESRTRPPAAGPRWRRVEGGTLRAVWPMDLEAGGTWIAASELGLCLCLLNLNPDFPVGPRGHRGSESRGLVIPGLIACASLGDMADRLSHRSSHGDLRGYAPFRLVGVEADGSGSVRVLEARWSRAALDVTWHAAMPACFVSSGLGDSRVLPRLELFEEMVVAPGPTPERQDEFHRHAWSEKPEISVLMSREEARTVSITTLEVLNGSAPRMDYEPVPEKHPAQASIAAFPNPVLRR